MVYPQPVILFALQFVIDVLVKLAVCNVAIHLVHVNANLCLSLQIDQF